jgi:hypothetical protein
LSGHRHFIFQSKTSFASVAATISNAVLNAFKSIDAPLLGSTIPISFAFASYPTILRFSVASKAILFANEDFEIFIMTMESSRSAAASIIPLMGEGDPFMPFKTVSMIFTQLPQDIPVMP